MYINYLANYTNKHSLLWNLIQHIVEKVISFSEKIIGTIYSYILSSKNYFV
jgi:hypothetical protein